MDLKCGFSELTVIASNFLHSIKTPSPIDATFAARDIDANVLQCEKAESPIVVILFGRISDGDNLLNAKEKLPILRIEHGS